MIPEVANPRGLEISEEIVRFLKAGGRVTFQFNTCNMPSALYAAMPWVCYVCYAPKPLPMVVTKGSGFIIKL